jgi:tetratricopeptide (TPR) repeat protein
MKFTTFVALLLLSAQCVADTLMTSVQHIESEWASIYYQTPKTKQGDAYLRLLEKTAALTKQFPNDAEPLFWQAVVKATYADHQDAMDALEAIKEARELLLKAIQINPKTMDGSAYVTLGTLYYMAPKWPIAFGDNNEAKIMLETALKINPEGIDANYFFGDFLVSTDRPAEAIKYFEKAAKAPARKEQSFADNQLKAEAKTALKNALAKKQHKEKDIFLSLFNSENVN